jgi:hypothetical protein
LAQCGHWESGELRYSRLSRRRHDMTDLREHWAEVESCCSTQ